MNLKRLEYLEQCLKMNIELYFFSGTGNSIHAARELQKRIPEITLKSIISFLEDEEIKPAADNVGIIFPIHAHTIPLVVEEFLKRLNLDNVTYFFALSNRYCADKVFKKINKILKKKNRTLDASFEVMTPVNYIPVFTVPTKEEIEKLETEMQSRLNDIQKSIINKQKYHVKTGLLIFILANSLLRLSTFLFHNTKFFGLQKSFYADENCIGCGTCERVCLSGTIKIVDKKPVWDSDIECIYCFACISYCPKEAIQAKGKRTSKKGRYHHPLISVEDIAQQK